MYGYYNWAVGSVDFPATVEAEFFECSSRRAEFAFGKAAEFCMHAALEGKWKLTV